MIRFPGRLRQKAEAVLARFSLPWWVVFVGLFLNLTNPVTLLILRRVFNSGQ